MKAPARAAWRAWKRGDIEQVEALAEHTGGRHREHLLFLTNFVKGRYERALAHYEALGDRHPGSTEMQESVAQAWLHLGQPVEAQAYALRRRKSRALPPDLVLRAERPLRATLDRVTDVPFVDHAVAPYLNAVDATLDGHRLRVHLDTGGTFLVMGAQRANELGLRLVANGRSYHGTTRTDCYFGMAGELTIGEATLTNVPVEVMPTLSGEQDFVLIGTNLLQQFLATLDHPGHRLLLSPRHDQRLTTQHLARLGDRPEVARIPFYLWGDHFMFARGGFGARQDLNLFIDSGLVYVVPGEPPRQASLYTTAQRSRSWGVPRAKASASHFDAEVPISLGPLAQDNAVVAKAPARRVPWRSFGGVRIDGLLSNGFLSTYAWTIDFDRHEYTFRQPGKE